MAESFKKRYNGVEYAFYRTTILNDVTYFIMFDDNGNRNSVRVARVNNQWRLPENVPQHISQSAKEILQSISENEMSSAS